MRELLELGCSPADESCVQLGTPEYDEREARMECNRFKAMLQKRFEDILNSTHVYLKVIGNSHDFGTYFEVAVAYDCDNEIEYCAAVFIENNYPATWDDDKIYTMNDFNAWLEIRKATYIEFEA